MYIWWKPKIFQGQMRFGVCVFFFLVRFIFPCSIWHFIRRWCRPYSWILRILATFFCRNLSIFRRRYNTNNMSHKHFRDKFSWFPLWNRLKQYSTQRNYNILQKNPIDLKLSFKKFFPLNLTKWTEAIFLNENVEFRMKYKSAKIVRANKFCLLQTCLLFCFLHTTCAPLFIRTSWIGGFVLPSYCSNKHQYACIVTALPPWEFRIHLTRSHFWEVVDAAQMTLINQSIWLDSYLNLKKLFLCVLIWFRILFILRKYQEHSKIHKSRRIRIKTIHSFS